MCQFGSLAEKPLSQGARPTKYIIIATLWTAGKGLGGHMALPWSNNV